MSKEDVLRICKAWTSFRPSFLSITKNLSRADLVFLEKSFRRTALEFNKLLQFIGTPTCVFRRTGELVVVGKEFALLTDWNAEDLVSNNRLIFEVRPHGGASARGARRALTARSGRLVAPRCLQFMDARSVVEFWEHFAYIAMDNSAQSVIARCNLLKPDGAAIPCSVCYTIKRDIFDMPLCIVGSFLPVFNSAVRL